MASKTNQKKNTTQDEIVIEEEVITEKKSKNASPKQSFIASWPIVVITALFIWTGILSLWFRNDIYNREQFTKTATTIINSNEVKNAISEEAANKFQEKFPIIGRFGRPLFIDIFSGILSSDLFTKVNAKAVSEIHTQLFVRPREVSYDISSSTKIVTALLSMTNPNLAQDAKNLPDKIVILEQGQFPTLSKQAALFVGLGPLIGALGLFLLVIATITAKSMALRLQYAFKAFFSYAIVSGFILYVLNFVRSQISLRTLSDTASLIALKFYDAFTLDIISFAKTSIIIGLLSSLLFYFLNQKNIFQKE